MLYEVYNIPVDICVMAQNGDSMRFLLALWICKLSTWVLRALHRGATALPGKLALRVCPDILSKLSQNFRVYVVSGTNGKTTTALLMASLLEQQGTAYISNRSGSNLERGIVSCFAEAVGLFGKPKETMSAVIECDEAAFAKVAAKLNPRAVVVTNFFKDQLDRYGEVTHTLELVKKGCSQVPDATLILNADDQLCASIGEDLSNSVIWYGMDNSRSTVTDASCSEVEAGYCVKCHEKLDYEYTTYGHLGKYSCHACGYSRPNPHVEMMSYTLGVSSADFSYKVGENTYPCSITVSGLYNIYNALGAIGFGLSLDMDPTDISRALAGSNPGFGRMETVQLGTKNVRTVLVKNPMGYNQVINYLISVGQPVRICYALNDNIADGTDISWLWDVNFDSLSHLGDKLLAQYVCGVRGADMAVRLKYAGFHAEYQSGNQVKDSICSMLSRILDEMADGETLVVLPSYTAMFEVRGFLQEKIKMKEFWN